MVTIFGALILPSDVLVVPVAELADGVRARLALAEGEYAVTRVGARTPSRIVDAQAAELLLEFRTARTIVDAVIRYSRARHADPERTLEEAFPLLERLVHARVLVSADSAASKPIEPNLKQGARVAGVEVRSVVQVLEDTEVYQAVDARGVTVALKLTRPGTRRALDRRFAREAAVLRHLEGRVTPALLDAGTFEESNYLLIEWCPGVPAGVAAAELRRYAPASGDRRLLELSRAVLEAYAHIHSRGVVHGDVHPRNLLVAEDASVKIIDFGLARLRSAVKQTGEPARGGVDFYLEPEYARAWLAGGRKPPRASPAGEQYSLAALIYELMTGHHYLDFSLEKDALRRQVAEQEPRSFSEAGRRSWPDVERVLRRALEKEPRDRFPTVADFVSELAAAGDPPTAGLATTARPEPSPRLADDGSAALNRVLEDALKRVSFDGTMIASGLTLPPTCSVTYGAAGIAYALYRIACLRQEPALLSLADVWVNKAIAAMDEDTAFRSRELGITPEVVGPTSLYHTASGVHCVQALVSQAMADMASWQVAVGRFVAASRVESPSLDLTLGRSGSLLGCTLLLETMPANELVNRAPLIELGERVHTAVWDTVASFGPIAGCGQLPFLGIAHGWSGVLFALLRWSRVAGWALPAALVGRLGELAELAEPIGRGARWVRKVQRRAASRGSGRHQKDGRYMAGWCNGSAGFVFLWILAFDMVGDPAYLELAERAGWAALEDADATGSLCCGLVGRAYALLALHRQTGDAVWLARAREVASRLTASVGLVGPYRQSLYRGELGAAVLAADLSRPEMSALPLFDCEARPQRQPKPT